ncbi:MAG: hypothetical protein ACK5LR_06880 [Mangrovibacterium sp.]
MRFTDAEYARFMMLLEQSGMFAKSAFVKARVFDEAFRVVKTDQSKLKYTAKLSEMQAQFRAIGVNYNQVVKELHRHFSEKTARAMLYKLEKLTTICNSPHLWGYGSRQMQKHDAKTPICWDFFLVRIALNLRRNN